MMPSLQELSDTSAGEWGTCLHGTRPLDSSPVVRAQDEALMAMLQTLPYKIAAGGSFSSAVAAVLGYLDELGIMDRQMFQHTVAVGVNKFKNINSGNNNNNNSNAPTANNMERQLAFTCVQLAITMEYWMKVGNGAEFVRVLKTTDVKSRRDSPWFTEWSEDVMNIATDRDIVRYLARHAPCDCLRAEKQEHRQDPKNKWCHKCGKVELDKNLMVCGKCKVVRYCSAQCQQDDWEAHIPFCKSVPKDYVAS